MSKEIILLSFYIAILAYVLIARKSQMFLPAIVAFAIGLVWTAMVGDIYGYNTHTVTFLGINIYALIAWSVGLLIVYGLYLIARKVVRVSKGWPELALFNALYIPLLIAVETVAYHGFNVVNVATSSYRGLPLCDCMHAPAWMQASYLLMGTVFFLAVWLCLKVAGSRNNHLGVQVKTP